MKTEFLFVAEKRSAYVPLYYTESLRASISLAARPKEVESNLRPLQLSSLPPELYAFLSFEPHAKPKESDHNRNLT